MNTQSPSQSNNVLQTALSGTNYERD